jgi:spermidine/putrescine transport system substrate-binding protein
MTHPQDGRFSRRKLLQGAAGVAVGGGAIGALAGCANTTTPVGACGPTGATDAGAASGSGTGGGSAGPAASPFAVAKPLGPSGVPLPRPDNSVTWAILDSNKPIDDGVKPEGGTLRIYNYADYIFPDLLKKFEKQFNCKTQVATYNSSDEARAKLASGQVTFDVVIGLSASVLPAFISQSLLRPLNHSYLPNLKNIWPSLQNPWYDLGARYTIPYVVWLDGILWRNDKIGNDIASMKVPWDIFWESKPWRGKVGILDDDRDSLSMPMQRDAMRTGLRPDLNTEDPALIKKAGKDLSELVGICDVKVDITEYQTVPQAKSWLHHCWSGDAVGAALYYMPKGVKPSVMSFWGPEQNGVFQNDLLLITKSSPRPALAHAFINFMLDEKNAYSNFTDFVGYTPPQNNIDGATLVKQGLIPKSIASAVLAPEQFSNNQELLALTTTGDKLWQDAWSAFKAG